MEDVLIGGSADPEQIRKVVRRDRSKVTRTAGGTEGGRRKTSVSLSADAEEILHRHAALTRRSMGALLDELVRAHVPRYRIAPIRRDVEEPVPSVA